MKQFYSVLFALLLVICSLNTFAQQIQYQRSGTTDNGINLSLSVDNFSFESVNYKGEEMQELVMSGIFIPNDEGLPNLPRFSRYIAIPTGSKVKVSVKSMDTQLLQNVNIAPALKIEATPEVPSNEYKKNEKVYSSNSFYPEKIYEVSDVTTVRGVDAVIIGITPFQYNPVTKELLVIKNIDLSIDFEGGSKEIGDNKYRSQWFDPILKNVFLNFEMLPEVKYTGKSSKDGSGCEYLIVIPNRDDFMPFAQQIKEYRTKQGIYTKIMRLDEMGVSNTTQLKTFFHNAYNTWDIKPVAVLLMGDHNTNMAQGIPAETISHPYSGSCITDNQYADVTGDKLPEMTFARMAAENVAQMQVLVSKLFEYEGQPCMDPYYYQHPITALGWQTVRWFQICSEVVGGYWRNQGKDPIRINAIYEGTPGSVWSSAQNTTAVVNYFGPSGLNYLPATPSVLGGWSGGTPAQVVTAVNNGAFALQHRDHGLVSGWGEPAFRTNHISSLTNVGKMTFLFTINCQTGQFNSSTPCFGEVFQRYTYQGQNAGCVGFVGPTEVSYSFVNDAYVWGMFDLFDPNFMPTYGPYAPNSGNWLPAFGNVAGKYFLAQSNWPYNTGDKQITYQMFTAHQDAFLRLYTQVPQNLTVNHPVEHVAGNPNFVITANAGSLIALTVDGEIIAIAEGTGVAQTINVPSSLLPNSIITVVCTKQDYMRYEGSALVIPSTGPYVIGHSWVVNDANGDGILQYGEEANIDMTAKNLGIETANNVVMTISSTDSYVTITDGTESFGTIAPNALVTKPNAFHIAVSTQATNNHNIPFNVSATDGSNVWTSNMNIRVFKPILEYESVFWQGHFDAGETLSIVVNFKNVGGAPVNNVIGTLTSSSQYVTIVESQQSYGAIAANGSSSATFVVQIANGAPTSGELNFTVSAQGDNGAIVANGNFLLSNNCNVVFDLYDSYGDGWNGASLTVAFSDGTPSVNYGMTSGSSATYTKSINVGTTVTISFNGGQYNSECSFTVSYQSSGDIIYESQAGLTPGLITSFVCDCGFNIVEICNPVSNLQASLGNEQVLLSWNATAQSYTIKRDGNTIGNTIATSYTDTNPPYGEITYSVIANCASGNASSATNVNVQNEEQCVPVLNLSSVVVDNNVTLSWVKPNTITIDVVSYNLYKDNYFVANIQSTSYTEGYLANGDYNYCVEAVYNNSCVSEWACISANIMVCYSPENIASQIVNNTVVLSWDTPNLGSPIFYSIYLFDDVLEYNVGSTTFTDDNPQVGNLKYGISAHYPEPFSCLESERVDVFVEYLSISDFGNNIIVVYPNPAKSVLNINADNIKEVLLYNTLGQLVLRDTFDSANGENAVSLNVSGVVSGVYTLKVCDVNGLSKNIKIVINK